jgi:hypothetical protein
LAHRRRREFLQGHIVIPVQQPSTNSTRTVGRNAFACAVATMAVNQIAFAFGLERLEQKPWLHGYRDPREHPGQGDV